MHFLDLISHVEKDEIVDTESWFKCCNSSPSGISVVQAIGNSHRKDRVHDEISKQIQKAPKLWRKLPVTN